MSDLELYFLLRFESFQGRIFFHLDRIANPGKAFANVAFDRRL